MKKFVIGVVALFYSFIGGTMVFADTWTQKTDFGGIARGEAVGFSIGNKGYIGTGELWDIELNDFVSLKDFWEYDPATDTWTQKADFGGIARHLGTGFSIGNKGYIGTGVVVKWGDASKDFWEYDPAVNTWTRKADFPGIIRYGAAGFSIGNKGYIGTGMDTFGGDNHRDFWEYNPAIDTWTQKADFGGVARHVGAGFSIGDKGYIGWGQDEDYNYQKDFWEYDPSADTWTRKADFDVAVDAPVAFSICNKGYVGTGFLKDGPAIKDFWEYDPATDTWTKKADFGGEARLGATGLSINNKGYIGTGVAYSDGGVGFRKDFWEYDSGSCSSNKPPDCSQAYASPNSFWPPNHKYQNISISGITDPDGDSITIVVNYIKQDEPVNGLGDGDTSPDATINPLQVRAERSGKGNGRVYQIDFTAQDDKRNKCDGSVKICVPHDQGEGKVCVDDGPQYDSTTS